MASTKPASRPRPGVRAAKRCAITAAARAVFAREGYTRASIDVIAAEAGVSTRTIYNHFTGKEQLFADVLLESAGEVATAFCDEAADRAASNDVRADLTALARAFAGQASAFPEHFAMVARIRGEITRFPRELVDAWHRAGPLRIQREVAERLEHLAAGGGLRIADPELATLHFIALITAGTSVRPPGARPPGKRRVDAMVLAGVDAFLDGYRACVAVT